jgi:hypothetical protein
MKNTAYQNLTKFLNINTHNTSDVENKKRVIIKGNSIEDVKRKGLEYEQQKSIRDRFFSNMDHGFQKAMQYEAARLPAYIDYEGMEYYPIIGSALDLYMEEATNVNDKGQMLNIYSNNDRIKKSLEDLFYNVVNVNTNLPFWVRNTVKYGDNFVNVFGVKKEGIVSVRQMVNYDIERYEKIEDGKPIIRFKNRTSSDLYNVFEVLHFRILGDDKYLPYGSSILNKVRRVFRQLILAEDAMLTYRIVRAGDRRVYRIDVGNMDVDDIEDYIYKVATKFKKKQNVDFNDGQIDYRFNILGNDEDIFLPMRNGNAQTGVDTLDGMKTTDIHDIEYLRDNLFTGLSIPKPFLGFQDAAGDGKNLAQHDIRFGKKIIRVQQAMLQELNKLAVMHLYLQGFKREDIYEFTLSMNNPSTQEETLRTELMQAKTNLYGDLTRIEGGIAAMSHTNAKKYIYNMSDEEIILDLKQQKIERAVTQELQDAPLHIKRTGVFDDIDNLYSQKEPLHDVDNPEGGEDNENEPDNDEIGGDEFQSPSDLPEPEGIGDSYKTNFETLLSELQDTAKNNEKNKPKKLGIDFITKNKELNTKTKKMISEMDNIIGDDVSFKTKSENIDEIIEIDDIDELIV